MKENASKKIQQNAALLPFFSLLVLLRHHARRELFLFYEELRKRFFFLSLCIMCLRCCSRWSCLVFYVNRWWWCLRVNAIKRAFVIASRFNLFVKEERDYDEREIGGTTNNNTNEWKKDVPLIPLVALVEFPPKKALLSNNTTEPPFSKTVCAADKPAKPPPMTITLFCWCWDIVYY